MGRPERLPILAYHALDEAGSVLSVPPRVFREHMRFLRDSGARTLNVQEIRGGLRQGAFPTRSVVLTFDDGFRSVYEHAFPILQEYGFHAIVFLVTDYMGKENSWPSQPRGIPRQPLLTWSQVEEMSAAGVAMGAHSRSHPDLTTLSRRDAEGEIASSRRMIEDRVGSAVEVFAYPYGAYNQTVRELAAGHFSVGCSAILGFAEPESDPFALERLDAYYLRAPALFRRLFSADMGAYIRLRRGARDLRKRLLGLHGFHRR